MTLDDPLVLSLTKSDPARFMQRFLPPVLIDEIQYAPELLPYVKLAADHTASTTSSPERFDPGCITVIGPLQPGAPPRSE